MRQRFIKPLSRGPLQHYPRHSWGFRGSASCCLSLRHAPGFVQPGGRVGAVGTVDFRCFPNPPKQTQAMHSGAPFENSWRRVGPKLPGTGSQLVSRSSSRARLTRVARRLVSAHTEYSMPGSLHRASAADVWGGSARGSDSLGFFGGSEPLVV